MDITIAIFNAFNRESVLGGAKIIRDEKGKPYRRLSANVVAGVSFTHVRQARPPFSLVAMCNNPHIGIDAEIWPLGKADPAFLDSVASFEDRPILARLGHLNYDPARFLWVVKEAALKASGEVMIDPRDLAVEMSHNGHIKVSSTRRASAPFAEIGVRILQLKPREGDETVLLAIATTDIDAMKIAFSEPEWTLQTIAMH